MDPVYYFVGLAAAILAMWGIRLAFSRAEALPTKLKICATVALIFVIVVGYLYMSGAYRG